MTLWIVRAGRYGEGEDFAIRNNIVAIGWEELFDLSGVKTRKELADLLRATYPDDKERTLINWESQLWNFIHDISTGDLVAMPSKSRSIIVIGEVTGDYRYTTDFPPNSRHNRSVKWLGEFPRNQFDGDLLLAFGSLRTVSRVRTSKAEERVRAMLAGKKTSVKKPEPSPDEGEAAFDLEQTARDQITEYISRKFKSHDLTRLVGAVLTAQGYQVRISPEGPDGGVDIIAGQGALGFEQPRLVVQVKSGTSPVDIGVLRELQGVMNAFGADLGLIVAWGGYKGTVEKEAARQFFKIRLWDADDLVQAVQRYYDQLSEDIQAELPLKRIWILVPEEEG
jgi:restriction system protein